LALALLALRCASGGTPGVIEPRKDLTAADYYPMASGWKWAYDLEKDGTTMLATYAVLERTADGAVIQAGDERLAYAVTPDGVAQREGNAVGDYVIRNPVRVGNEWAVQGGRAKIVAVDQEVNVESIGKLRGCVTVEATRAEPMRVTRTTFAPDVGPVVIEVLVQDDGRLVTSARAHLRAITKPGQDLFADTK
jgi:hypothetical protein